MAAFYTVCRAVGTLALPREHVHAQRMEGFLAVLARGGRSRAERKRCLGERTVSMPGERAAGFPAWTCMRD